VVEPEADVRGQAAAVETGPSGPADLVDGINEGLRTAIPGLDSPTLVLTQRAVRLAQLLERTLAAEMAEHGLSQTDYAVLTVLLSSRPPYELRPTDLRERLLITSGGLSNVLNRLVRSGLLERVPDRDDGRSSWVRLTGRGVELASRIARGWARRQDQFYRDLGHEQVARAADALRDVLVGLGDSLPHGNQRRSGRD
jgi:DNA-binding MarR family transcriptional regulator